MEEVWYKDVAYEDAKELVKENLVSTVAAFIASGYWLKYIRDCCDYKKDGYLSLWECAEAEFGLGISEASRAMSMNDKYSTDGNSPFMAELYKKYNKSQLQEMLTMSDEQLEQVTPDMTVKSIREIKKQKPEDLEEKQEKLKEFAYDFVWAEYVNIKKFCFEAAGINMARLREVYDGKLVSRISCNFIMFGDDELELVSEDTGEIIGKYSSDAVAGEINDSFLGIKEQREHKISPEVKGLMDDPYCSVCGTELNSPKTAHMSLACPECGQAVEWKEYIEKFCDVATDSVNTECEEDLLDDVVEDILTEIEITPEQEEPLNIEFDTEELMKEFEDDVIDGEYIEVPEEVREADEEPDESNEKVNEPEKLSAYGLCKTEYPEESTLTVKGCGHKYSCFMCARKCDIRQEMLYCVDAPLGNPFGCTTMNVLENLNADIGDKCQFINLDMAEHSALNNIPEPCCKKCQVTDCGYRCYTSALAKYNHENDSTETVSESETVAESNNDELSAIKQLLSKKSKELKEYLECEGLPEKVIFEEKTIVAALANMVCELEDAVEAVQPELPTFRNNEQRKAWLEDVEAWGLWYEDRNIQARYYKYDFPDGSRLIAVKYRYTCPPWLKDTESKELDGSYKNTCYHMIYSEEYRKNHKYEYEKYYTNSTTSISALVEFIKEIVKKANKNI